MYPLYLPVNRLIETQITKHLILVKVVKEHYRLIIF